MKEFEEKSKVKFVIFDLAATGVLDLLTSWIIRRRITTITESLGSRYDHASRSSANPILSERVCDATLVPIGHLLHSFKYRALPSCSHFQSASVFYHLSSHFLIFYSFLKSSNFCSTQNNNKQNEKNKKTNNFNLNFNECKQQVFSKKNVFAKMYLLLTENNNK